MEQFLSQPVSEFRQPLLPPNNISSFIYTNAILRSSEALPTPLLHFWTLDETVILGLKDQRLPHLATALDLLRHRHHHYFIRNSGGLAVVSDNGILNCSLFFPWHLEKQQLMIDEAYQRMVTVIQAAFPELAIETGEVTHSYCPGSFDVQVNGQKIGGISQRRNMAGVVVMLLFFYLIGLGLVFGAHLNAALAEPPEPALERAIDGSEPAGAVTA